MNVWEGITVNRDELFGTFEARRQLGRSAWATIDMVLDENLICYSQISLAEDFFEETARDGFVGFC